MTERVHGVWVGRGVRIGIGSLLLATMLGSATRAAAQATVAVAPAPSGAPASGSGAATIESVAGGAATAAEVEHAAFVWPTRFGEMERGTKCVVVESERAFAVAPWIGRAPILGDEGGLAAAALRRGIADAAELGVTATGPGYLLFRQLSPGESAAAAYASGASKWFRVASGRVVQATEKPELRIDQTWFGLYEPTNGPSLGVVLVLPGMLGTPEPVVEGMVSRLREKGLAVLRCLTHPSRYCSHRTFEIDAGDGGAGALMGIAAELDDRVAEYAYAVQAAWRFAVDARADLRDLPRGAVGMSGGAIALPSVVALEPEKYRAAVLIAGGCNGLEVADRSNYADMLDAVRIRWKGEGGGDAGFRSAMYREYLKHTTLDGYHTARSLKGKKVLVIHATRDEAVPSSLGQLLWERLGKPERWVYPMSHEGVFAMQLLQNGRTADWVAGGLGVKR